MPLSDGTVLARRKDGKGYLAAYTRETPFEGHAWFLTLFDGRRNAACRSHRSSAPDGLWCDEEAGNKVLCSGCQYFNCGPSPIRFLILLLRLFVLYLVLTTNYIASGERLVLVVLLVSVTLARRLQRGQCDWLQLAEPGSAQQA